MDKIKKNTKINTEMNIEIHKNKYIQNKYKNEFSKI